jgi:DNA-binding MarR family transcriptional regulator
MSSGRAQFDALGIQVRQMLEQWTAFADQPRQYGTARRIYPSEIYALDRIPPAGMNISALALALAVTKSAASQIVDKLVRKGLARKVGGQNAREVCVELTAAGRTAVANSGKFFALGYRLFRRRHGAATPARIQALQAAFLEFTAFFEEFVRHCPPDFPISTRGPARRQPPRSSAYEQER